MPEETVHIFLNSREMYIYEPESEPHPTNPEKHYFPVPRSLYDRYWKARNEFGEASEALYDAARDNWRERGFKSA